MIKLYGFTMSNYFNMVKMALLEKEIAFEVVDIRGSQDENFLKMSPMGKVPCIETEKGFLSETNVILEYLEDLGTGPNLMPADPYERAKVRELMKEQELYLELPARTCFPEAFFGGSVSDEVKETARVNLAKGIACLKRNGAFSPFVAGDHFTMADVIFQYSANLAGAASKRVLGMDLFADLPEAKALLKLLGERASAKQVAVDQAG